MASIEEKVGKKPSVHISQTDLDNAEAVGKEHKPPSTALTEGLEDSVKLQEIQESKKKELRKKIEEMRKTCRTYGIDFSDLL